MPTRSDASRQHMQRLLATAEGTAEIVERLQPRTAEPPKKFPAGTRADAASIARRLDALGANDDTRALLDIGTSAIAPETYERNIENFIGTVQVPVGIAGPLRVNGIFAHGDYHIPLATTEAALVASYHRGACLVTAAGGAASALVNESLNRSPAFAFATLAEAGQFLQWTMAQLDRFREIVAASSRHARLLEISATGEGNHIYLNLEFTTGDASGQNMVTLATQRICDFMLEHAPVRPRRAYVEGNLSGDKKASAQAFNGLRGKKVIAEVKLPAALVERHLHATPREMEDYWRMSAMGGVLSGTIGVQGHFANGLAALFIACGQDPACVAECAVGVTRFEVCDDGALYAAVTLPSLMLGTVGGGTGLPTQRACLELMGLVGEGKSGALAEVVGALILAGELSIIGALAAGHFARAHERRARKTRSI
jgi:hydroxymethylglutaryl-CoA reductase (NADPH)